MNTPLWLPILLLAPLHAQEGALPRIKNGNLNSSIFLAGWQTQGPITKGGNLTSETGKSATIGANGVLSQDFITPPKQGLNNFRLSFVFRIHLFDGTARFRLRQNENKGDLITLRPTTNGLEAYTNASWKHILTKPLSPSKSYEVTITANNLNKETRSYIVTLDENDQLPAKSAPLQSFHTTAADFETVSFDTTTSNGLTVDNIQVIEL